MKKICPFILETKKCAKSKITFCTIFSFQNIWAYFFRSAYCLVSVENDRAERPPTEQILENILANLTNLLRKPSLMGDFRRPQGQNQIQIWIQNVM